MDIKKIVKIAENPKGLPAETVRSQIIFTIADDKDALGDILEIISNERNRNKAVIDDMNVELSRAHIYIDEREESKQETKERFNKPFVLDKIAEFYIKYKGRVTHCFNRFTDE